jgi:hypothetical protein
VTRWAYILLFGSLLLSGLARADEGLACFPKDEARQIVAAAQKEPLVEAQAAKLKEENAALAMQNDLLKQNNALLKETVGQYKELLQVTKDSYEGIIEANKPNPLKEIIDKIGAVGIGVLVGLALIL